MMAAGMAMAQDVEWRATMVRAIEAEPKMNPVDVVSIYREAKALADRFAPDDPRRWSTYNRLGVACEQAGMHAESVRIFRDALSLIKSAVGTETLDYATATANLGTTFISLGEFASAESLLRKAEKILRSLQPVNPSDVAMTQSRLVEALLGAGKRAEAEHVLEAALPVLQNDGRDHIEVAIALNSLGIIRRWQHRYDDALRLFTAATELIKTHYGAEHPLLVRALNNLAVVYELEDKYAEAEPLFREAQAICDRHLPPTHPSHAALLLSYADFLRHTGEKSRAKSMEQEARSLSHDNVRTQGRGATVDVSAFRGK